MKKFARTLAAILCITILLSCVYVLPVGAAGPSKPVVDKASEPFVYEFNATDSISLTTYYKEINTLLPLGSIEPSGSNYVVKAATFKADTSITYWDGSAITTKIKVENNNYGKDISFNYSFATNNLDGEGIGGSFKIYSRDITDPEVLASLPTVPSGSGEDPEEEGQEEQSDPIEQYRILPNEGAVALDAPTGSYTISGTFYMYITSPDRTDGDIPWSDDSSHFSESSVTLSDLSLIEGTPRTVYVEIPSAMSDYSNCKITVNGNSTVAYGERNSYTVTSSGLILTAVPGKLPTGKKKLMIFAGYKIKEKDGAYTEIYLSDQQTYVYKPTSDETTITADFIKGEDAGYLVGSKEAGFREFNDYRLVDQYVNRADTPVKDRKYIIVIGGSSNDLIGSAYTQTNGVFTIPSGSNLLVPFDDAHTFYSGIDGDENQVHSSHEPHDPINLLKLYRKLSLTSGAKLVVKDGASVCVCAQPQMTDPNSDYDTVNNKYSDEGKKHNGPVHDKYAELSIAPGCSIELEEGSNLFVWGFITGESGKINAYGGSTICEFFQINDFRGGTETLLMASTNQFPFNQYYVQNIGCEVTYHYGSCERVFMAVYMLEQEFTLFVDFITSLEQGMSVDDTQGFYILEDPESKLIRKYDRTKDTVTYKVVGHTTIASLRITVPEDKVPDYVHQKYGISSITLDSRSFYMPICNMQVELDPGAVLYARGNYIFLPGSSLTISGAGTDYYGNEAEAAKLVITDGLPDPQQDGAKTGCDIVFAGQAIGEYSYNRVTYTDENGKTRTRVETASPFKPSMYFPGANLSRTWANTEMAELNNNGSIVVDEKSSLRSTQDYANIYSSENTGTFIIGRSDNTQNLYVRGYVGGSATTNNDIQVVCTQPVLRDSDNAEITENSNPIIAAAGTWYDDWDDPETAEIETKSSQGNFMKRNGIWGDFRDVTYYNAPKDIGDLNAKDSNGDSIVDLVTLGSYTGMNVNEKETKEEAAENDSRLVRSFTSYNDRGVKAYEYQFITEPGEDETNWKYEPVNNETQDQLNAYPRYTKTAATHTVTFEIGGTIGDIELQVPYGESPNPLSAVGQNLAAFAGIRDYVDPSTGYTMTFAGWESLEDHFIYKPGEQLPPIEKYNDPTYTIVYKPCFEKNSLTLTDDIETNFYVRIPYTYFSKGAEPGSDAFNANIGNLNNFVDGSLSVKFEWGKKYTSYDDEVGFDYSNEPYSAVTSLTKSIMNGDNYGFLAKVSVDIAAKEINDQITASLIDTQSGKVIAVQSYSAADYLYDAIYYDSDALWVNKGMNLKEVVDFKKLCVATLAYGASAQVDFEYNCNNASDLADYKLKTDPKYAEALAEDNLILDPSGAVAEGQTAVYTHDNTNYLASTQAALEAAFASKADYGSPDWQEKDLYDMDFTGFPFRDYSDIFDGASTAYYGSSLTLNTKPSYDLYFRYGLGVNDPEGTHFYWSDDDDFTMFATLSGKDKDVLANRYQMTRAYADEEWDFIRLSINGIEIANLTEDFTVYMHSNVENRDVQFEVNPGVYLYNACKTSDAAMNPVDPEEEPDDSYVSTKNTALNLYNYNQMAIEFFKPLDEE